MAKKKLLNEAQVRRFMGLAGLEPLKEMYNKREDDKEKMEEEAVDETYGKMKRHDDKEKMQEEVVDEMYGKPMKREDEMEETMYEDEMEKDDEMGDMEGDEMGDMEGDETVDLESERVQEVGDNLMDALEMLKDLGYEEGAPADDMGMDEPAEMPGADLDKPEDDEKEDPMGDKGVMEALDGVNLELSQNELVSEVARRVAKRILKAKQAKKQMDEALGNNAKKSTRRLQRK